MSATTQVKAISLSEAIKREDDPHLYVINQAHKISNGIHGNITMNVHSKGRTVGVSIASTWIPLDLTTQAPREDILSEPNFRRIAQRGAIAIIDSESAMKFMEANKPRSEAELQKVLNVYSDVENSLKSFTGADKGGEITINVPGAKGDSGIDPFVEAIVGRAETEPADDLISELNARLASGGLTSSQIQYIMDSVASADLKDWCVENVGNGSDINQ